MSYANPAPFAVPKPAVAGTNISLDARTVAPPIGFGGAMGMTGPVTNGPSGSLSVPGLGSALTGPMSTLYNGGTPGNRQMGMFWAQESVKQQYVIINDKHADPDGRFTRALSEGALLFNAVPYKPSDAPAGVQTVHDNVLRQFGEKLCVVYDINGVNNVLRCPMYKSLFDSVTSADEILSMWRPLGVLKNEAAPSRQRIGEIKSMSRLVNLVVSHRVRTFNIWGGDVAVGTRLYIICKQVESGDVPGAAHSGYKHARSGAPLAGNKSWIIYPYADKRHRKPPVSELMYTDSKGNQRMGSYVCIGFSNDDAESYGIKAPVRGRGGAPAPSNMWHAALSHVESMSPARPHVRLLKSMEIQLCV